MDWSWHTWIGFFISVLLAGILLGKMLRKKVSFIENLFTEYDTWFHTIFTVKRKKIFMLVLGAVSSGVFVYCYTCESRLDFFAQGLTNPNYFHLVWRYLLRISPLLVGGILLAGVIEKYFHYGRFRLPSSMLGAGVFASVIPMCSCAAVPIAHSLVLTRKTTLRAVVVFLFVVPVLNPYVIFVGTTVIGWDYTMLRIASVFMLAVLTGLLMERFIGIREETPLGMRVYSCQGCSMARKEATHNPSPSALLSSFNLFFSLLLYIIIGVAVGAAMAKYFPPQFVGKYLSSNTLGLFLATSVGLPLFICAGEEILILKPLLDLGLPMGHAITFTIAGNGICLASLPILIPLFGKKATIFITVCFFVGSFLIGLLINSFWR